MRSSLLRSSFVAFCLLALPAHAAEEATIGKMTKKELDAHIKQFLMDNPDVITDSMQYMRKKQMDDMKLRAEKALERNKDKLNNDKDTPYIGGGKNPDVTVVEFFDYHCGYCKHVLPIILKVMKDDPKVRFVFKDMPILSEDSITAAAAGLAVWRLAPDKYLDYYTDLMQEKGQYTEEVLLQKAAKLGIPKEKMKAEMTSDGVKNILKKNRELALDLQVRGTPAFAIGSNFLPGALDEDLMKQAIAAARAGKKLELPEEPMQ